MGHTYIIAEAGVNHNGSLELAMQLVEVAHAAGADAVKFQTFKAKHLVTASAQQAEYQITNTQKHESQLAMLSRLELGYPAHHQLIARCQELGIDFLSTAFDEESLEFLTAELHLQTLKIPSGEITNAPLILAHARSGAKLIVSTGMTTLEEVEDALGVIAFGYTAAIDAQPSQEAFRAAFKSASGQQALKDKVTLLHCTTEYPAPLADINLKAMDTMATVFHLPVGYSDHSEGIVVPIAAVARGAIIIEKHFTLDKNMEGPDHKASLEPVELHEMVTAIRNIEIALGSSEKQPQASEIKNIPIARKSLVAAKNIEAGELLTTENIAIKRPGSGASPFRYWELTGCKASRNYAEGDCINE